MFLNLCNTLYFTQNPSPDSKPTVYIMHYTRCSHVGELSLNVAECFKIISDLSLACKQIYHHQLPERDVMTLFRLRDMIRPIYFICVCLLT
jgi:hypothetical protein